MKKLLLMVLVVCAVLLPAAAGAVTTSDELNQVVNLGESFNIGLSFGSHPKLVEYLRSKNNTLPVPPTDGSSYDYSAYYQTWKALEPGNWTTDPAGPIEILDSASQPQFYDLGGEQFWDAPYVTVQWKSGVTASDALSGTVTYTLGDYQFVLTITPGSCILTSSVTGATRVDKTGETIVRVFAPVGQDVTLTANVKNRLNENEEYDYYWYEWNSQTNSDSLLNTDPSTNTFTISLDDEKVPRALNCFVCNHGIPMPDLNNPPSRDVQAVFQFDLYHESAAVPGGPGVPGIPEFSAVPAASPDVPATGDENLPLLWLLGLMASGGAIVLLRRRAKRSA